MPPAQAVLVQDVAVPVHGVLHDLHEAIDMPIVSGLAGQAQPAVHRRPHRLQVELLTLNGCRGHGFLDPQIARHLLQTWQSDRVGQSQQPSLLQARLFHLLQQNLRVEDQFRPSGLLPDVRGRGQGGTRHEPYSRKYGSSHEPYGRKCGSSAPPLDMWIIASNGSPAHLLGGSLRSALAQASALTHLLRPPG
jgi:hypothetical protein